MAIPAAPSQRPQTFFGDERVPDNKSSRVPVDWPASCSVHPEVQPLHGLPLFEVYTGGTRGLNKVLSRAFAAAEHLRKHGHNTRPRAGAVAYIHSSASA